MKFLVVTNAPTFIEMGKYFAYAPYVNEMNKWFEQVDEVRMLSPATYPESVYVKAFDRQDTKFFKLPFLNLSNPFQILRFFFLLPFIKIQIIRSFIWADHIHLRCPGNIGLIASVVQIFFPQKPKTVKYAGNWDPNSKQPWSYNLQKWILSNTFLTKNMKVLVYGDWPNQTKNISPFFTASFCEEEKEVHVKEFIPPYKFLFVGSLVEGKQPLFAVRLVEALNKRSIPAELHIYGDGLLKNDLEKEAENKNYIHLHGNHPLEVLKKAYKDSHFLILASKSEGWPKAVAEAMFFGCVPIVMAVSCVPWMLGDGSRGILISEGNVWNEKPEDRGQWTEDRGKKERGERKEDSQHLINKRDLVAGVGVDNLEILNDTAERTIDLIKHPEKMRRMSIEAQEWSQEYTLERFEEEIKKLLFP